MSKYIPSMGLCQIYSSKTYIQAAFHWFPKETASNERVDLRASIWYLLIPQPDVTLITKHISQTAGYRRVLNKLNNILYSGRHYQKRGIDDEKQFDGRESMQKISVFSRTKIFNVIPIMLLPSHNSFFLAPEAISTNSQSDPQQHHLL